MSLNEEEDDAIEGIAKDALSDQGDREDPEIAAEYMPAGQSFVTVGILRGQIAMLELDARVLIVYSNDDDDRFEMPDLVAVSVHPDNFDEEGRQVDRSVLKITVAKRQRQQPETP